MLNAQDVTPVVPTAEFFGSLVVSTVLQRTSVGLAAFVVVGHPVAGAGCEPQLVGLAGALGLRPSSERLASAGRRVVVCGSRVLLVPDRVDRLLGLPPVGERWLRFVAEGGPVCVVLGLDPLPPDADRPALRRYLADAAAHGRAHLGIATLHQPPTTRAPRPHAP